MPVLLPVPIDGPFDYAALSGAAFPPGTFVEVPFGPRTIVGVVWDRPAPTRAAPERLKAIVRPLDAPPMPAALRRLVDHVAEANLSPRGAALKLAIPSPGGLQPPTQKQGLVAADAPATEIRLTAARQRVLEVLGDGRARAPGELASAAGVGAGVLQGMTKAGLLVQAPIADAAQALPDPERPGVALSPAQAQAASRLRALIGRGHAVQLLEGVPGAGKTEVYLEAVAEALRQGCQALVLLPEIALSTQVLERFARRFGLAPALWHSELGAPARRRTFRRIAEVHEPIVVGARSALFLPFTRLGVIIVDEEHDSSFKQEDGVTYHARDMGMARGSFEDCPVILVSATPALDTAWRTGRTGPAKPEGKPPILLPSRHGGAVLPKVHLLDLKGDRPASGRWLAPALAREMAKTLASGEQALLFLNRRGFAPLTLCRACGFRIRCPNCSAWLVEHRFRTRLVCHHCGYTRPSPEHCPDCGSIESLVACGPGVERLADEVADVVPEARIRVMTSDSPASPRDAAALLRAMHDHEIDVLIGTQIVAKGHHFPKLTLVGVIDGDLGLAGGDLRAAERQFQLLYQVAGRAGREQRPGLVLIQTHYPEHPVMQALAAGDKQRFYENELAERRAAGMPPFGRLAALIVSGREREQVDSYATRLARTSPQLPGLRVLGPAPAPLGLLRGRHRVRLLAIAKPEIDLTAVLRPWLAAERPRGNVRLQVDVDPYSFF